MGLLDRFRREKAFSASPAALDIIRSGQFNSYRKLGGSNQAVNAAWLQTQSASYAYMYEHQPAVRTVIDYIARNVAQLGLKLYERKSSMDREYDEDHPACLTMEHPNDLGPANQWIFNFVADYLVHDNAYAIKFGTGQGQRILFQVPPAAVGVDSRSQFKIDNYRIYRNDGSWFDAPPESVIHWRGYNPSDSRIGISRLETLRLTLAEEAATQSANVELMKAGMAQPGYIKRPLEAPEWTEEARKRFQESWANQSKQGSRRAPVLEEGMEFADFGVSPKDAQMLDGRRFTLETVARLYGLKNVPAESEEERKQFYSDVLPPICESLSQQLDFSLLLQEYSADDHYFEFDLVEKLRGDPVARYAAITSATGGPWMLRSEARALESLPEVEGADELIVPMNVIVGDNPRPAPNVMPPQDPNKPLQDGSYREEPKALGIVDELHRHNGNKALQVSTAPARLADMNRQRRSIDEARAVLERFYARQRSSLKSKGAKQADSARWNRELADDINSFVRDVAEREGGIYVARLGGADFDIRQVENYLKAMSENAAANLNSTTQADIEDVGIDDAYARASNMRAEVAATSLGARSTVFARMEAAKQAPGTRGRVKTWVANSERHASLDGVSVALDSDWGGIEPGDEPNCGCTYVIN